MRSAASVIPQKEGTATTEKRRSAATIAATPEGIVLLDSDANKAEVEN